MMMIMMMLLVRVCLCVYVLLCIYGLNELTRTRESHKNKSNKILNFYKIKNINKKEDEETRQNNGKYRIK